VVVKRKDSCERSLDELRARDATAFGVACVDETGIAAVHKVGSQLHLGSMRRLSHSPYCTPIRRGSQRVVRSFRLRGKTSSASEMLRHVALVGKVGRSWRYVDGLRFTPIPPGLPHHRAHFRVDVRERGERVVLRAREVDGGGACVDA
jgi:hypothetical protein